MTFRDIDDSHLLTAFLSWLDRQPDTSLDDAALVRRFIEERAEGRRAGDSEQL